MNNYLQMCEPDKIEIDGLVYYASKPGKQDLELIESSRGGYAVNIYVRQADTVRDLRKKFEDLRSYRFHWIGEHEPLEGMFSYIFFHHRENKSAFYKITLIYREVKEVGE